MLTVPMSIDNAQQRNLYGREDVQRTLELLLEPGQVTELRVIEADLGGSRPETYAGYFERERAADLIYSLFQLRGAKGIYFIPNPLPAELLARANNVAAPVREGLTKNHEPLAPLDPGRH